MPERLQLAADKVAPAVHTLVERFHRPVVDEVASAVARDRVVVVGMAGNPFVRKARALLTREGVPFTYLEYGGYLSRYRERLALKLWAGYPLFPMVFLDGTLEGGYAELEKLANAGRLAAFKP